MFESLKNFFVSLIKSRILYLIIGFSILAGILIYRIFDLQIINGENYLNNFQLKIKKERTIDATRGNIYDCNGVLLAYNELAYSITIEDVFESGSSKNYNLNKTIKRVIDIIEENGDELDLDFYVSLDDYGNYEFTASGTTLNRFKADIYGCAYINDMTYAQSSSTAKDIVDFLCGEDKFEVYELTKDKDLALKIAIIRYEMSLNAYQKYIATTIATNVSEKTIAVIYENSDILEGVNVKETTKRVYPNGIYTAMVVGYTGKISLAEYEEYSQTDSTYSKSDSVGKAGIEKSQEAILKGIKGSETIYVNTTGKVISSENYVESVAGSDVYLSIDSKLQEDIYHILEQKLAGVLLKKITNTKEYIATETSSSSDITIPIYSVYYQLINNSILDINHFSDDAASDSERLVYEAYLNKKAAVFERLKSELTEKKTVYNKLTTEYKVYENFIEDILLDTGILISDKINYSDDTYIKWAKNETISLSEYINYCISQSWIDIDCLDLNASYSESEEIYLKIVEIIFNELDESTAFEKILYKYIIKSDAISPRTLCNCLLDQEVVSLSESELSLWYAGKESAYDFMINRITNLEITPAQLALEPCTGSVVVTDVNTGKTLAIVSYPGYDNNYLANGADAQYLKKITNDLSMPMLNYATQQRTAPGSTYKMVTATAGLLEGVINTNSLITCTGSFEVTTDTHKCWIYPGTHGSLNVTGAINKSCNCFFYTVGYRLSLDENGEYNSKLGVDKLNYYASMYGLSEKSGVEIEEYSPILTNAYSVPSAIGQGTNSFTTVGLARYVTAIANRGTVYNLTLLDKICDNDGSVIKECEAEIYNRIEMDDKYWDAICEGMRRVTADKAYFREIPFDVAGKTGTAQQSKADPDHGLFVSFAPFNNPKIAVAARIANGYTSDYAANVTKDVYKYYFKVEDSDEIVNGTASALNITTARGD